MASADAATAVQPQPDRDTFIGIAKLAEQTERYDEMAEQMKALCRLKVDLTPEERNFMSIAFKNWIGLRRASLRTLVEVEQKESGVSGPYLVEKIKAYRQKVENELDQLCNEVISIVSDCLIPSTESKEIKAFYWKIYLAEFMASEKQKASVESAQAAYNEATTLSADLAPTNPVRLGLALNFSVFKFEILSDYDGACKLAKQAFDDAVAELDNLADDAHKESTMILQFLRDNLALWTSNPPEDDKDEAD